MADSAKKKTMTYPDSTVGSKLAASTRTKANSLSDSKRDELTKHALAMIHGAPGNKKAVSTRH